MSRKIRIFGELIMRKSITDGRIYYIPDYCPYCQLDTAGNHEVNCPMNGAINW